MLLRDIAYPITIGNHGGHAVQGRGPVIAYVWGKIVTIWAIP